MKFSIIVPTFNEEAYVSACLKSLRDQSFDRKEFEIIVADSNSSDRTAEIARSLAGKVVVTDRRGIAHGRNFGARHSAGDILLFVDADVTLDRDFLVKLERMFRDPTMAVVTGIAVPNDGKWAQRAVYRVTFLLVRIFDSVALTLYPGLCVAYRKIFFERAGGFREDFGIVEDLDLSRRVSQFGKSTVATDAIAYVSTRRLGKNGLSTVLFHIYNDLRYLFTGRAAKVYPKVEELNSPLDLWRMNKSDTSNT